MGEDRLRDVLVGGAPGGGRGRGGRAVRRARAGMIGLVAALAALSPGARAQQTEAPQPTAPAEGTTQDLSVRYRFVERYGLEQDVNRPDQLVQYQVGMLETNRRETEQARGAPERQEITYQTIYTERPARLGRLGEVTDAIRRYDRFQASAPTPLDPRAAALLKGLTIWYRPRPAGRPEMICLTPNRPISQMEYDGILNQIFTPRLGAVLPSRPVLVGDRWTIQRQAARVLLGKVAEDGNYQFDGILAKVEKSGEGTAMTAIIDLEGLMDFEKGAGAVRARLWFVFEPIRPSTPETTKGAAAPKSKGAGPGEGGVVEARGHVARLSMSLRKSEPLDEDGRLQEIRTGEIQLRRRLMPPQTDPLAVPKDPPTPDEANSWLVFDDPEGRFHLRHRQDLAVEVNDPELLVFHADGIQGKADTLMIADVPKDPDPAVDRQWTDPQAFVKYVRRNLEQRGFEVINGPMGALPEADWAPLKRKVYRYESALKTKDGSRMYVDAYLVLFSRGNRFFIQAMTNRDDHLVFREQAEKLIKSLDLGPSTPRAAGAATRPPDATAPGATAPAPSREIPAAPPVPRLDGRP